MKKLLSLIGTFALIVTTTSPIMACLGQGTIVGTELDKVLTNTTLNPIYVGQRNEPNDQEIKDAIKKKNTDIDIDAIEVSKITKESAIVTGNNTKYTGAAVTVKFISTNFTELKGITGIVVSSLIVFNDAIYIGIATSETTGKLYRSTDDTNFEDVTKTATNIIGEISSLTVFNSALYVGTDISKTTGYTGNLYRSTDGTKFVDVTKTATNIIGAISSLTAFNNALYVGTGISKTTGELFRSTDGTKFEDISTKEHIIGEISSLTIINNKIYVGTAISKTTGYTGNLYRSTDGTNFVNVTKIATNIIGAISSLTILNNALYVGTVTAFGATSTGKLYKSTDGNTFEDVTKTATNNIGAILSLTAFNNALYVGTEISKTTGKLYRSTDGNTFEDISKKENIIGSVNNLDVTNGIIYVNTITAIDSSGYTGKLYKSDNW